MKITKTGNFRTAFWELISAVKMRVAAPHTLSSMAQKVPAMSTKKYLPKTKYRGKIIHAYS